MFTTNPFSILAETIPMIAIQSFVIVMVGLVILGTVLGPVIYLFSSEWSLLFAGLIAGTVAYLFGEKGGK